MKPYVGMPVVLQGQGLTSNGAKEHPGVVTRVWSDSMINAKVFPDCGAVTDCTSVPLVVDVYEAEKRIMIARMSDSPHIPTIAYPTATRKMDSELYGPQDGQKISKEASRS